MVYQHLKGLGFPLRRPNLRKSGESEPDFCVMYQERAIWIEAVCPSPAGIPASYLQPPRRGEITFKPVLSTELLLRFTSVLTDKRKKLTAYMRSGVISENDCTVVAINSCRLYDWRPDDVGHSGFPLAVEAVFPVGPLTYPISVDGRPDGEPTNVPRYEITKPDSDSSVPTDNFLNPDYAVVSTILACYHKYTVSRTGNTSLTLVHNPLAVNRLPRGVFGAEKEYVAERDCDHYLLRRLL
jgi:hypothetical protein